MGLPNYQNPTSDVKTVRRYFSGTTVLRKGQFLGVNTAADVAATDPKLRLGFNVVVIAAANLKVGAGFVSESSAGLTGPCFVDLLVPQSGDVIYAEVEGTTDIAIGDLLEPDNTLGGLIKATAAAGDELFVALEAYTPAGLAAKLVYKV